MATETIKRGERKGRYIDELKDNWINNENKKYETERKSKVLRR